MATTAAHSTLHPGGIGERNISPWTRDRTSTDPSRHSIFYLGSHRPHWIESSPAPLFISARTLGRYSPDRDGMPATRCAWALDSGGFTELQRYGTWEMDPDTYGGMVYRFIDRTGYGPTFAAPQDWMCEPAVIRGGNWNGQQFAGTGLSIEIHQELTIENYLYLTEQFPAAPWIPVLQGWDLDDYLDHAVQYRQAGVVLEDQALVGVGSVCRRQSSAEIATIFATLAGCGLRLHGFGVKINGLARFGQHLASADSMAWSYAARRSRTRLPDCQHRGDCRNCLRYALIWRERVLDSLRGDDHSQQLELPFGHNLSPVAPPVPYERRVRRAAGSHNERPPNRLDEVQSMCSKRLMDGPLVCTSEGDEHDGHSHSYESNTGSWVGPDEEHG